MFEHAFGPIRQWGFLVKDIEAAMASWVRHCGVGPWWGYRNVMLHSSFDGIESDVRMHVALAYQNGMQIELIQQLNDVVSPYRFFHDMAQAQVLHQVGYAVPDIDRALEQARMLGLAAHGVMSNDFARYVYLEHPAMSGLVIELMPADPATMAGFDACAKEAATWDGTNPYRLLDMNA